MRSPGRRPAAILILLASGAAIVSAAAATIMCVPADTRPPPGVLTLTVSPSETVSAGIVTVDGWTLTFDRVFVSLGDGSLSDACNVYGEAEYDRVLNLRAVGGGGGGTGTPQKLGVIHGLGQCDLRFRISPPGEDAVLGAEVSEEDKATMRAPFRDPYVTGGNGNGTSIDISAIATRGEVTKRFRLLYRQRIRYQRCTPDPPPADASTVELTQIAVARDAGFAVNLSGNENVAFDLRIEPEGVFRDDLNPSSANLRFDPFAAADINGDGVVTLDELRLVPISAVRDAGAFEAGTYDVDDGGLFRRGRPVVINTLGDFVYELLVPTLLRFRGAGWCVGSVGRR